MFLHGFREAILVSAGLLVVGAVLSLLTIRDDVLRTAPAVKPMCKVNCPVGAPPPAPAPRKPRPAACRRHRNGLTPPFRVETKAKVPIFSKPEQGDTVTVSYDPKSRKAELHIEGDPRYDPKLLRAAKKQQEAARKEALLSGAPVPDATARVHFTDATALVHLANVVPDEPLWTVPTACPECGARVDQPAASMAEHPKCEFCGQPLPCERIRHRRDY